MPSPPCAAAHQLVLSHGNGPQVGLLALQASAYKDVEAYPLDVLGAQTEGMIGYLIEQELGNLLPCRGPAGDDPDDGRGRRRRSGVRTIRPSSSGRSTTMRTAEALATEKGWAFKRDGEHLRRVVASPAPKRIFEIRPIRWLLDQGTVVICAGGGGIPTSWVPGKERTLEGIEAVIDKDLASELLAREIDADLFVMATDVDGVYEEWGTPEQRKLDTHHPGTGAVAGRSPPGRWGPRSRPRRCSSSAPASAPRSARSPTSTGSWPAKPARASCPQQMR